MENRAVWIGAGVVFAGFVGVLALAGLVLLQRLTPQPAPLTAPTAVAQATPIAQPPLDPIIPTGSTPAPAPAAAPAIPAPVSAPASGATAPVGPVGLPAESPAPPAAPFGYPGASGYAGMLHGYPGAPGGYPGAASSAPGAPAGIPGYPGAAPVKPAAAAGKPGPGRGGKPGRKAPPVDRSADVPPSTIMPPPPAGSSRSISYAPAMPPISSAPNAGPRATVFDRPPAAPEKPAPARIDLEDLSRLAEVDQLITQGIRAGDSRDPNVSSIADSAQFKLGLVKQYSGKYERGQRGREVPASPLCAAFLEAAAQYNYARICLQTPDLPGRPECLEEAKKHFNNARVLWAKFGARR
jgi:hypothetical protein